MLQLVIVALAVVGASALHPDCGRPAIAHLEGNPFLSRVVGGQEARVGSWPWQVQLKIRTNTHYCGGIILDEDWVLTAAHCVDSYSNPTSWTLAAGSHNKNSVDAQEQTRRITRIIKHASYDYWTIDNDVALMRMQTPWEFNDYVGAACLPSSGEDLADGVMMYTTGYGSTGGTCCANKLKQAMVPHVSYSRCRSAYSSLTTNMVCAGFYDNGGHDACQGDSGGPLVSQKGDRWVVYGIVSWGNGCALPRYPGVYTKVSNYVSWITSNTRSEA